MHFTLKAIADNASDNPSPHSPKTPQVRDAGRTTRFYLYSSRRECRIGLLPEESLGSVGECHTCHLSQATWRMTTLLPRVKWQVFVMYHLLFLPWLQTIRISVVVYLQSGQTGNCASRKSLVRAMSTVPQTEGHEPQSAHDTGLRNPDEPELNPKQSLRRCCYCRQQRRFRGVIHIAYDAFGGHCLNFHSTSFTVQFS